MTDIEQLAETLDTAALNAKPVPQLTIATPSLTLEQAYRVQRASMARRASRGDIVVGLKMGLTSVAKMKQVGVHEPIYGHLTRDMRRGSGDVVRMSEQIHPRIEPEVAFILGADLRGPTTAVEALAAVEWVVAALEVIDSRYEAFRFTLADVVADNASSTRFFLGDTRKRPDDLDLGNLGMVMSVDGVVVETGSSAAILDHPARSLAALANMLASVNEYVPAGSIVLAGAATAAKHVQAGQVVTAEVDGLGQVTANVVD